MLPFLKSFNASFALLSGYVFISVVTGTWDAIFKKVLPSFLVRLATEQRILSSHKGENNTAHWQPRLSLPGCDKGSILRIPARLLRPYFIAFTRITGQ